jgi:hypothetical protein
MRLFARVFLLLATGPILPSHAAETNAVELITATGKLEKGERSDPRSCNFAERVLYYHPEPVTYTLIDSTNVFHISVRSYRPSVDLSKKTLQVEVNTTYMFTFVKTKSQTERYPYNGGGLLPQLYDYFITGNDIVKVVDSNGKAILDREYCEVHKVKMSIVSVGKRCCLGPNADSLYLAPPDQDKRFPHCQRGSPDAGSADGHENVASFVCSECEKAFQAYLDTLPKPSRFDDLFPTFSE